MLKVMHNYRPLEGWMRKGAKVQMPNNTGTLQNLTVSKINRGEGDYVLACSVQPDGVKHSFPFNPWDIEPVAERRLPFPEVMG